MINTSGKVESIIFLEQKTIFAIDDELFEKRKTQLRKKLLKDNPNWQVMSEIDLDRKVTIMSGAISRESELIEEENRAF